MGLKLKLMEVCGCVRASEVMCVIYAQPIKQGVGGTNRADGISPDGLFVVMLTFIVLCSFVFYSSDEYETQSIHLFEKEAIY